MSEVKYSKEHEWIKLEGDVATIGITKHATEMLGDIVFVELPEKGLNVETVVYMTKTNTDKTIEGEVMDTLGLHSPCCRRVYLTHVDIE